MPIDTFTCPNCGAPLDYDGSGATTVHCPYCQGTVVVPETLRPKAESPAETITVLPAQLYTEAGERQRRRSQTCLTLGVIGLVLFVIGVVAIPMIIAQQARDFAGQAVAGQQKEANAVLPRLALTPTAEPTDTPEPTLTPAFMNPVLKFGEKGIAPGLFNDARYLALDGEGHVYVADYDGGRVQVFDSTGKYLRLKMVGDQNTIIHGMAADRAGNIYLAYADGIFEYDGGTGKLLTTLTNPNGGEYGDLTITADSTLLSMWYEGRWGLITSLEGHREDLIAYSPQGEMIKTVPSLISAQTGDLALDVFVSADGLGNLFALSQGEVFKFSPAGKYINRWSLPNGVTSASAIAVDGQGRVYVGGSRTIFVFSADGRPITEFPTPATADQMAFDGKGNLWMISRDQVIQFAPLEK